MSVVLLYGPVTLQRAQNSDEIDGLYYNTDANIYVIWGWSTVNDQQEGEFVILCQMLTKGAVGQMMTIDDEEGFHK